MNEDQQHTSTGLEQIARSVSDIYDQRRFLKTIFRVDCCLHVMLPEIGSIQFSNVKDQIKPHSVNLRSSLND